MCAIVAYDLKTPYEDEESSIGYRPILKNAAIEKLEPLGATLNFFDIWLKLLDQNCEFRCGMYNRTMKNMFQKYQQ